MEPRTNGQQLLGLADDDDDCFFWLLTQKRSSSSTRTRRAHTHNSVRVSQRMSGTSLLSNSSDFHVEDIDRPTREKTETHHNTAPKSIVIIISGPMMMRKKKTKTTHGLQTKTRFRNSPRLKFTASISWTRHRETLHDKWAVFVSSGQQRRCNAQQWKGSSVADGQSRIHC